MESVDDTFKEMADLGGFEEVHFLRRDLADYLAAAVLPERADRGHTADSGETDQVLERDFAGNLAAAVLAERADWRQMAPRCRCATTPANRSISNRGGSNGASEAMGERRRIIPRHRRVKCKPAHTKNNLRCA